MTHQHKRAVPIRVATGGGSDDGANVKRQRAAVKKMDIAEQITGIPAPALREEQQAMKAAALKRFTR